MNWLKSRIKSRDEKYLEDQNLLQFFKKTKNKIWNIFTNKKFI
jgi:hypothetical protein